jgi:hypothetical protein
MNTLFKIATTLILIVGLSIPAYAGVTASGGAKASIGTAGNAGGVLEFTPSGNTLLGWTLDTTVPEGETYVISAACSKTTTDNGIIYGMINSYSGYYQQAQAADVAVPPTSVGGDGWTAMGGAEEAAATTP